MGAFRHIPEIKKKFIVLSRRKITHRKKSGQLPIIVSPKVQIKAETTSRKQMGSLIETLKKMKPTY